MSFKYYRTSDTHEKVQIVNIGRGKNVLRIAHEVSYWVIQLNVELIFDHPPQLLFVCKTGGTKVRGPESTRAKQGWKGIYVWREPADLVSKRARTEKSVCVRQWYALGQRLTDFARSVNIG